MNETRWTHKRAIQVWLAEAQSKPSLLLQDISTFNSRLGNLLDWTCEGSEPHGPLSGNS